MFWKGIFEILAKTLAKAMGVANGITHISANDTYK